MGMASMLGLYDHDHPSPMSLLGNAVMGWVVSAAFLALVAIG